MKPKALASLNSRLKAGPRAAPCHRGPVRMRSVDGEDLGYTERPKRARMAGSVTGCPNS